MLRRQEWLLLALARRGKGAMTPVQVQKAMFLMSKEAEKFVGRRFYRFKPYDYGPFDQTIYFDLGSMEKDGLVITEGDSDRNWSSFVISPEGLEKAKKIRNSLPPEGVEFLDEVVDWVCDKSFSSLVRTIYDHYPEFKVNSVFTD